MKKHIIPIVALVAITLPSLYLFGVKDFYKIGGVVNVNPLSRPTLNTFANRSFQISAEDRV